MANLKLFEQDTSTPMRWLTFILMTVLVVPMLIYLIYNWIQPASSSPSASPRDNKDYLPASEMSHPCTKPRPIKNILLIVNNPKTPNIIGALLDFKKGTVNSPKIPGPETIAELLKPQYVDICVTQLSTARSHDNSLQWLRLYVNARLQYDIILYDESIVTKQAILEAGQHNNAIFININDQNQVSPAQKNALLVKYTSPQLETILDDYFPKPRQ